MRYRLRTLLIVLVLGPPVLAWAWWYGQRIPLWVLVVALIALIPDLLAAACAYGFGGLCHLIGRLPGGNDRKDTKF